MALKKFFGKKSDDDLGYEDDILGPPVSADDGGGPASFELTPEDQEIVRGITIRSRAYTDYNKRKVNTILSKLHDLDKHIFTMLPALVHLNEPGLPGYIEDADMVPEGVIGYKPSEDLPRRIERLIQGATINIHQFNRPTDTCPIYSLSAMGSLATIAQTSKSDFDIWVCVNKADFTKERLAGLARKLEAIEIWADKTNHFECHFFITDITEARNNTFGESDSESAGSALGKLLKEEFFRTHTVFAGLPPLWTVMPSHLSDEEYERIAQIAFDHHIINKRDYIDLGNAQLISVEESFGAVLWQLNKALGSPFKSAMKMGLIEDYMDKSSNPTLLCDDLKQTITELGTRTEKARDEFDTLGTGELLDDHPDRFALDGYLLMFNRILEYYKRMNRSDLQEILRQCFYLKAGDTISGIHDPLRKKYRKKDMLAELIEGWGWENDYILDLNKFKEWPFDRSVKLGGEVNNFIIDSYKRLSQTGATSKAMINETDLTVLGRKLFTFYSRKEKKVDYLPRTFEESLHQGQITFAMTPSKTGGAGLWKVYRGSVNAATLRAGKGDDQLLRQTRNLPELLVWLVMNGVWDRRTQVNLQARESPLTAVNIQDILESLRDFFPPIDVGHLPNEDLLSNSKVERLYAIINLGDTGHAEGIRRIDFIYRTSWGEIYTERPPGKIDSLSAIRFALDRLPRAEGGGIPAIRVYVPSGKTGVAAAGRKVFTDFEAGLQGIASFFHSEPLPPLTQRTFVFKGDSGVICASWNGKETNTTRNNTFEEFFQKRERGQLIRSEIALAESATEMLAQQTIVKHLALNVIQVFMLDDGISSRTYISDEMGGSTFLNIPKKAWPAYSVKMGLFLSNIANRIMSEPWRVKAKMPPVKLAFYHVVAGETNPNLFEIQETTMKYLQAIENRKGEPGQMNFAEMKTKDGKRALVFQVDGEKITSLKHGGGVFQAAAAHFRKAGRGGSISLADLSLSPEFRAKNCPRGAKAYHFLAYKSLIERKLNEALKSLT